MSLITITSVPATTIDSTKELQVAVRWKSTEKRTIPAANAQRAVILPATIWSADIGECVKDRATLGDNNALRMFLLDAVFDLAKSFLSTIVEESNWQRTSVNLEAFTLPSLLQWSADQAAVSGRLNGEEIAAWCKQSATIAHVTQLHGDKIGAALSSQFVKLASPNHGLTPEKAGKMLESLWQKQDADTTTGLRVLMRMQSIRDKAAEAANMLDSIL